jgi:hypothetical protein
MSETSPIFQLAALAEEELGLVAAGRFDEIADVQVRRDGVLAQLPDRVTDPAETRALADAHALQIQVTALLEQATADLSRRLNRIDRGRGTVQAYAASLKAA